MIRHVVDRNQLLPLVGKDAGDVFLQFVIVLRRNEILPALHGEHDVNVDLGVGVGHEPKMPLLTELGNLFVLGSTKISRLRRSWNFGFRVLQRFCAYGATKMPPLRRWREWKHFVSLYETPAT